MSANRFACFFLILLVSLCAFSPAAAPREAYLKDATISETAGTVRINADSPRPLEQVLDALQRKYGWVVNYEDPQYVATADYIENAGSDPSRIPAGRNFQR